MHSPEINIKSKKTPSDDPSWFENRKCANILICTFHMVVLLTRMEEKYFFVCFLLFFFF